MYGYTQKENCTADKREKASLEFNEFDVLGQEKEGVVIFPFFSSDLATNTSIVIGLSIDNKTSVDLPKGFPPVQITFFQVGLNFCR